MCTPAGMVVLVNTIAPKFSVNITITLSVNGQHSARRLRSTLRACTWCPFRPTAVMGPHRIGFVGEGLPFYGGYSYGRWRRPAINHSWNGTGSPVVSVRADELQQYPEGPQNAYALFTWSTPGIYEVHLTVQDEEGESHTGTRQVV